MSKRIKSLITIIMSLMLVVGTVGCSSTDPTKKEDENTEKKDFKVGVVLGEGGANDQSFNQYSLEGFNRAKKEVGVTGNYLESNQEADHTPNIEEFVDQEVDLIIGVGYTTAAAMLEAAKLHTDKNFVMVDHNYEEEDAEIPSNMTCVTFDEREAAYLVGLIAGKMNETSKVGFIGGMEGPNITRFQEGFIQGVNAVDKNIKVLSQYANTYDDASIGKSIANQMYSNGADIIFSAAGNAGTGAIEAAKEQNKYAIGVDMDQNSLAPDNVISSAMKRVDMGVFDIIDKAKNGKLTGGKAIVYGLKEKAVGIAPTSNKNVPKDILDYVNSESEKIINGELKIIK